jgi:hypothetical protein
MRHIRTFHDDVDASVAGAEHGDVEYAITRDEWQSATGRRSTPSRTA